MKDVRRVCMPLARAMSGRTAGDLRSKLIAPSDGGLLGSATLTIPSSVVCCRCVPADDRVAPAQLRRARQLLGGSAGRRRGVLQRAGHHGPAGRIAARRRGQEPVRQRHPVAGDPSAAVVLARLRHRRRRRRPARRGRLHKRQLRQGNARKHVVERNPGTGP